MPKRNDLRKVMIIGSGPIVIGQACEFDYSGAQACKALAQLGYEIVLANSNPATIMTDPSMADATYIEPLTAERMTAILAQERPDALLPNLGGQTGLNLCAELARRGVLEEYGVEVIGVPTDAIQRGEDRQAFKDTMERLGIEMPRSEIASTLEEAERVTQRIGLPAVVRPAFTLGGTGGGLVYNLDELRATVARGLAASMIGQVLIEESVEGWEELEVEVVRDLKNQLISVCFIENVDPMGVHTGDSYCVSPMLTIAPELRERLEKVSHAIVEAIGVTGGTNVQMAHDPQTGRLLIIEINPRTSRSSALASKATGFPIARLSALLASGITLDEIPYWRDGTLEKYTQSGDYVVVKFCRWAFEKFPSLPDRLGTQMLAVGEVMSLGRTYQESLQKAIRSVDIGRHGLGFARNFAELSLEELLARLAQPSSERQFLMYEALRQGASVATLFEKTHIKPWFIEQMKELVEEEQEILRHRGQRLPDDLLIRAKKHGFADRYLAELLEVEEQAIRAWRKELGLVPSYHPVRVSGVEQAEYYYSSFHGKDEAPVTEGRKVMVLGGGPNRIGQGIEFDYCCVHAAFALREQGVESIMVNCNPETVSTDYDTADRLYFEPLTVEEILGIYEKEKPEGVIVQFGGQTPLNIANDLAAAGVRILGTSTDAIDLAEDRDRFRQIMRKLGIPEPESGMASTLEEALVIADKIGYPLIVRPSFVLGGRAMEIVYDADMLKHYVAAAVDVSPERPILIERFLENAIEAEADAIADGRDAFVPAVMEHIELAGIHSGDSACVIPPVSISEKHLETIADYTRKIAIELNVVGLINVQYAIFRDMVYILEANPRASRTVPLVSKICDVQMVHLATQVMLGKKLDELDLKHRKIPHFGVKEAVFPFNMYHGVDPVLGPEMRSTGEVLGLADSFDLAFFKAEEAAQPPLPQEGTVLITVADRDKPEVVAVARRFAELGFRIRTTQGTHALLAHHGIHSEPILKIAEGRPNIADAIVNGEIQLVINTPRGKVGQLDDSYIRTTAIRRKVPYITTLAAAHAAAKGIAACRAGHGQVRSLQSYHAAIS